MAIDMNLLGNLSSYNTSCYDCYQPESWIQSIAILTGRYFFLSAFFLGLATNLVLLFFFHRHSLGNIKLGAVAIVRCTAYIDLANLVSSALFTWVLNYTDVMSHIKSVMLFNFLCKFYNMITHLTIVLSEWVLVVFALERAAITYKSSNGLRYFSSLRIRIGFSLFTIVLFAASCNYMWMFGRSIDESGIPSCLVRPEFFAFYYEFLVYLEPIVEFLAPHGTIASCCVMILYLIFCRGRQYNISLRQTNSQTLESGNSPLRSKIINRRMMQIFFLQAVLSIVMDLFRNFAKLYSIVLGSAIFLDYQSFLLQVHVTKFCLKDLFTTILVFTCVRNRTFHRTETSEREISQTLLSANNRQPSNIIISLGVIEPSVPKGGY